MTQATDALTPTRTSETKLVAGVCIAHLVSHYYMVLLAPLFVFIKADYDVSYTELSLALTAFATVSAVMQTPVGFFIDRTGARINLIGGLLLGSAAVAVAGLVDSFPVFIAMYAVLGLANTVYHPADYTLLSEHVPPQRMTQVFSYHTCFGMIGSAIAPVTLLFMQGMVGWRGAFLCERRRDDLQQRDRGGGHDADSSMHLVSPARKCAQVTTIPLFRTCLFAVGSTDCQNRRGARRYLITPARCGA